MAFPDRRVELYEEALDALLKKWDSSRSIQRDTFYKKLSLGHKRQMLMELAAETFETGQVFIRKEQLATRIEAFLKRLPGETHDEVYGEDVLRAIEAQHGLLIERAQGIYSFSHLTFQEYFTARYIASNPHQEQLTSLISHANNTRWREVLILTASLLDHGNSKRLFRLWSLYNQQIILMDSQATSFVNWLVSISDSENPVNNYFTRSIALVLALADKIYSLSIDLKNINQLHMSVIDQDNAGYIGKLYELSIQLLQLIDVDIKDIIEFSKKRNIVSINFIESFLLMREVDRDDGFEMFSTMIKNFIVKDVNHGHILRFSDEYVNSKGENGYIVIFWYAIIWAVELARNLERVGVYFISKDIVNTIILSLKNIDYYHRGSSFIHELLNCICDSSNKSWDNISFESRNIIYRYSNVGYNWDFSEKQLMVLGEFIIYTKMMIECLSVAYILDFCRFP